MNRWRITGTLLIAACLIAAGGQVQAGIITADFETTLGLVSGPDAAGLDGATLSIHAEFDDAGVFVDNFGAPALEALTHTITIAGATVGSSNGVFFNPDGLFYFPTGYNGFWDSIGGTMIAGPLDSIRVTTNPGTVVPAIGDTISVDNLNTTVIDPLSFPMTGLDGSMYDWVDGASLAIGTASAVPEPTTLAMWGMFGAIGLIAARRRRKQVA